MQEFFSDLCIFLGSFWSRELNYRKDGNKNDWFILCLFGIIHWTLSCPSGYPINGIINTRHPIIVFWVVANSVSNHSLHVFWHKLEWMCFFYFKKESIVFGLNRSKKFIYKTKCSVKKFYLKTFEFRFGSYIRNIQIKNNKKYQNCLHIYRCLRFFWSVRYNSINSQPKSMWVTFLYRLRVWFFDNWPTSINWSID